MDVVNEGELKFSLMNINDGHITVTVVHTHYVQRREICKAGLYDVKSGRSALQMSDLALIWPLDITNPEEDRA